MVGSQLLQGVVDECARLQESYFVIRQSVAGLRLSRWHLTRLLAAQIWRDLPPVTATVLVGTAVFVLAWAVSKLFFTSYGPSLEGLGIPLMGQSEGGKMDFRQMMENNAKKFPGRPYRIRAFGTEYVVFPSKFFDEVKRVPVEQASMLEYARHAFHTNWTGMPRHSDAMIKAVAVDLSRAVPSLISGRQKDCAAACDAAIGDCLDWKEITLYPTLSKVVVSTNAKVLVGSDLGGNDKWISHVERLPMSVALPTVFLSLIPVLLRPLFKPLVFAPIRYSRFVLSRLLAPVLQEDMMEYETNKNKRAPKGPKANGKMALTSWLMGRYPKSTTDIPSQLTNDYLDISFESTPSTSGTLFYILVELAADLDLAEKVRQELREMAPRGSLPSTHLNELKIMDSVMRESARVNPFSHLVLYRKVLQPLKLSVGPELPKGSFLCVYAHHLNFSPELWEDPERFDGLRHYRARQQPGNENRFKFANLADSTNWGDGTQACPGRLLADNTLKIILTHILTHYDIKLMPGEGKPKKGSMPNGSMYPDMKAKVLFRSRREG